MNQFKFPYFNISILFIANLFFVCSERHLRSYLSSFKQKHNIKEDTELTLRRLTNTDTIVVDGNEYSLRESNEIQIFTSTATYMVNNIHQDSTPRTNMFIIKNDSEDIIISKNNMNEIKEVSIQSRSTRKKSVNLISVESNIFATIQDSDIDTDMLNSQYLFDDEYDDFDAKSEKEIDSNWEAQECDGWYNEIEIAIAYDSSYCDYYSGDMERANESIFNLVARVSYMYQQKGLCTVLKISHLETNCDASTDPYKDMLVDATTCTGDGGVKDQFEAYWRENRQDIYRDVAHLMTGSPLGCSETGCVLGCASRGAICDNDRGYGVNHLTYSEKPNMRVEVFAHELGHNSDASHTDEEDSIMYSHYRSYERMFIPQSMQEMLNYYNSTEGECIEKLFYDSPPTLPPTEEEEKKFLDYLEQFIPFEFLRENIISSISFIRNIPLQLSRAFSTWFYGDDTST